MAFDRADFYDAELQRYHAHFLAALNIDPRDRILDIGCGAGQSTRDAARAATAGHVLGIDVSEELLAHARRRSIEEGSRNIAFELGDAQVHPFPIAAFDLCISRFGVMFFADPIAAFTNIGRALRPGARLVLLVWQERDRNEWATAIQEVLAPEGASSPASAFSLADPVVTTHILTMAGFSSIAFTALHEPVFYGPDVDATHNVVGGLYIGQEAMSGARAPQRLRALLEAHRTRDGVLFDSHAWIVTAYKT